MVMYHLLIIHILDIVCLLNSLQRVDRVMVSCLEIFVVFHGTQVSPKDDIDGYRVDAFFNWWVQASSHINYGILGPEPEVQMERLRRS